MFGIVQIGGAEVASPSTHIWKHITLNDKIFWTRGVWSSSAATYFCHRMKLQRGGASDKCLICLSAFIELRRHGQREARESDLRFCEKTHSDVMALARTCGYVSECGGRVRAAGAAGVLESSGDLLRMSSGL